MEFIKRQTPRDFNLFLFGDVHIGSALMTERGFLSFIDAVESSYADVKHNVVLGMGDFIEAIDTSDKRFDMDTVDAKKVRIENQIEYFIDRMHPIRKKIAGLVYGNHEYKLIRQFDYVRYACKQLGVPYGTYSAVVTLADKKENLLFKTFITHGMGSVTSIADSPERRAANMKLSIKRKLGRKFGDCALMAFGHTHKLIVAEPESALYLTSDGEKVTQKYTKAKQNDPFIPFDLRWYVNTGSFMRLYKRGVSGYAERAMYDPMEIGYPIARVRNGEIVGIDRVIV